MKKAFTYIAVAFAVLLFLFFAAVFIPFPRIEFPEKDYSELIISNINVIDLENDTILADRHLLIRGDKIVSINTEPLPDKADSKRIDGTGKYILPALWDMHTHLTKQAPHSAYAWFVAHGVLHVRDMRGAYTERDHFATTPERIRDWNRKVDECELLGPMVHDIPGFAVEGPHRMFDGSPEYYNCANPEQARQLVSYFEESGITLIKTYNNIPREAYFTLMKEAKRAGIDVAGHKPVRASTIEAANSGMKSLEHARFLLYDSYPGAEELRRHSDPKSMINTALRREMVDNHDPVLLQANLEAMKQNNTYYCPTHLTRRADAYAGDTAFRARYDRINPLLRTISFEDLDAIMQKDSTGIDGKVYRDFYKKGLEITKTASDYGIKVLAGSDVPELPGSSLPEELQELSRAGLSNYEVLKTATLYPAMYYKKEDVYGSVAEGRQADLIILSDNPVTNISVIQDLDAIVHKGTLINRQELEGLKENAQDRDTSLWMTAKLIWSMLMYMTI